MLLYAFAVNFEWDEAKRESNQRKHLVDFAEAAELLSGPTVCWLDTRFEYGEDRWIAIGLAGGRILVVLFVEQAEDRLRIISMRKATGRERRQFTDAFQD